MVLFCQLHSNRPLLPQPDDTVNITSYLKHNTFLYYLILFCFIGLTTITGFADTGINNTWRSASKNNDNSIKEYSYEVVNVYPHDPGAFTQGLIFKDGFLYESTGRYGHSSLRKVSLADGKVIKQRVITKKIFAEGLATDGHRLLQLSWKAGKGFIYNVDDLRFEKTFDYASEGWGLAYHNGQFVMSDGTAELRFFDSETMQETGRLQVTRSGQPLQNLNELEVIKGKIFANVWHTDYIVIINPESGVVEGQVNLRGLLREHAPEARADVLNGIAYDASGDRLFVTGKLWPKLFEIRLIPSAAR